MTAPRPDRPTGPIRRDPILQTGWPREYVDFLGKHDPIENWESVVPLERPLEAKGIEFPMPWGHIEKLVHYAPNLAETCKEVEWGNTIAAVSGLRYAYTRLIQHAHILNALDALFEASEAKPTAIVEVGCFTGGLLHFLAERHPSVQCVGFDLSPVALDVASRLSDVQGGDARPMWVEGDFSLMRPEVLPDEIRESMRRPIVILSNVLHAIGQQLSFSPAVDQRLAEAGLVSYWVNHGATVVVSEREDDAEGVAESLVANGRWRNDRCDARVASEFECWSTRHMGPECPLGEWFHSQASVLTFRDDSVWD